MILIWRLIFGNTWIFQQTKGMACSCCKVWSGGLCEVQAWFLKSTFKVNKGFDCLTFIWTVSGAQGCWLSCLPCTCQQQMMLRPCTCS